MKLLKVSVIWILITFLTACGSASPTLANLTPATAQTESSSSNLSPSNPIATSVPIVAADILFTDGVILTMNDSNPVAQAIAIQGNSIVAVGSNDETIQHRNENTLVINLEGKTLLPGFIDSHTHRITQRFKWGFSTVEEAAQEALSQGWTGLSELAVDEGQFDELREAAEQGRLNIRVNVYLLANTFGGESLPEWYNAYEPGQQFGPYLRIAGLKVFIDGNSGRVLYWEQQALNDFLRQRQSEGWQISMKAIGIQSHELAITAFESLLQGQNNEAYRYRIEHSLAVNDNQLSRLVQTGIITAIQPSFPGVIWHEPDIRALTDEQGMQNIFRWREYHDAGVMSAASPYNPDGINDELTLPSHVSPMGLLHRSVTQIGLGGSVPEAWMLEKTLTVEELLPMLTIRGAYANFEDATLGSLETGKLADIVILSENPQQLSPEQLNNIQVLMTMIDGQVKHCTAGYETLCPLYESDVSVNPTPESASDQPVISSAELSTNPASDAFDGNLETIWNSGAGPEQWIQIDLGNPTTVSTIRLHVAQFPEGETVHQVWIGADADNLTLLHEFKGITKEYDILEFISPAPLTNIRYVKIITTQSPSWVAWREIEIK